MLFSNACLQWIPNHAALIPRLMQKLHDGGVLAVQIPMNGEEPLFRLIEEVAAEPRWGLDTAALTVNGTLPADDYIDILSACTTCFETWETVYHHRLPSHEALVEWVKGARLRPYLAALDAADAVAFEKEIVRRAAMVYPVLSTGEVLLRFRRFFFVAVKI